MGTATSVSGNYSSYNFQELGSYWNGTVAAGDTWFMNDVLGTGTAPTSTLYIQHTGSSGVATVSVPSLTIGAGTTVTAFGTSANNALQLDSGGKVPVANLPAATPTVAGVVVKVANTTFTTSTSSVAANTCNSTVQVAMTGVTTSMTFGITPSADTSAAAGWGSTGGLVLDTWPTAGYLNYKICNQTTAAISTPDAVTFNVSAQ
jgi:hypothetical protein